MQGDNGCPHLCSLVGVKNPICMRVQHIVWYCTLYSYELARNRITDTKEGEWADLDTKIWVPNCNDDVEGLAESDDQQVDGVERFFDYLAYQF